MRKPRWKIGTLFLIFAIVIFVIKNRDSLRDMTKRQSASSAPSSAEAPVETPAK